MTPEERKNFWEIVESGDNPLLSVISGLVEKWGMPTWLNHELLRTGVKP